MLVLLVLLLSHQVLSLDLNIYKSVSEVRQLQSGSGKYERTFSSDEYENVIENSINWSGTPFVKQQLSKTINTLKNALVKVKQVAACECRSIEAEIIDPRTMLLKNKHTGHFFYADARAVEYVSKRPSDEATTLTIEFEKSNTKFNGTLSYLLRGINWTPNYDLFDTNSDSCALHGYANIQNSYQQDYQIDRTHLYSSDPQLAFTSSVTPVVYRAAASAIQTNSAAPLIQSSGEEKGFYSYALNTKYTLGATSSIRMPFVTTKLHCEFYYQSTLYISAAESRGALQRAYDLTANQFLPGGLLAVRNETFLIGQVTLADFPDNSTRTITLGKDPDVQYVVKANTTATNKNNTKLVSQTYSVDVSISNHKAKAVKGELRLSGSNLNNLQNSTCNSLRIEGNLLHVPFSLQAKADLRCQFSVTLNFS